MKNIYTLVMMLCCISITSFGQVGINSDNSGPDPSAMLEVKSTTKGTLLTRMTLAELSAISNPANGLQVFCTTDGKMYIFVSSVNLWKEVAYGTGTIVPPFSCGHPITDIRDGMIYNTVQIGTQCWLKENLNTGIKINGSEEQTNNGTIEKYCTNNLESNCAIYGGLYQWNEMMQYVTTEGAPGICPAGWHIPTDAQLTTLSTFLGGETVAGGKMKTTGTIEAGTGLWYSPNAGATNESGFSGVPAGHRSGNGTFEYFGRYGLFWSSTELPANTSNARYRRTSYIYSTLYRFDGSKSYYGFSVRCLRD
jgi:uncharacterized protein (TIGR02145 family)